MSILLYAFKIIFSLYIDLIRSKAYNFNIRGGILLAIAEKIRIIMLKRNIKLKELAEALGTSQSNISDKLRRDNLNEKDVQKIAEVLNCDVNTLFTFKDTGEEI